MKLSLQIVMDNLCGYNIQAIEMVQMKEETNYITSSSSFPVSDCLKRPIAILLLY